MVITISEFHCRECGQVIPLPRKQCKQREEGHIKHIWCVKCKTVTAHVEQRFKK